MTFVNRLPRLVTLIGLSMLIALLPRTVCALTTSTVQGTVYRADGKVASGTLLVSWPAFTTSANEAVAAGNKTVAIGSDGWVSLGLAPNAGATPAGTYYTAVYHLNDGSTSTEYWVVPTSTTASLASVRAQVMPAAVAMQSVSKQYVDSSVANVSAGLMQSTGGIMNGPLTLSGDPSTNLQAATKHYVDQSAATNVSKAGDVMTGPLTTPMINGKSFATGMTLQQAINAAGSNGAVEIPANYTGKDTFSNPHGVIVTDLRVDVPVNSRSVKEWGARCDGTTDDSAAMQAAFDAEWDSIAVTNKPFDLSIPNGTCIASIQYRGESFHGSSTGMSRIKGLPGRSVLESPDNADGPPARGCCFQYARVHDVTIVVDSTVDANIATAGWAAKKQGAGQGSIFANTFAGWAGQTVKGAVTAGATSIPLTTAVNLTNYRSGVAMTGWVKNSRTGEFMQYYGITNTGCPNSAPSCLLRVTRGDGTWNGGPVAAAMNDGDTIVPLNILDPTNVTDWIPAWTVGACGISIRSRDGLHGPGNQPFSHSYLNNLKFITEGGRNYGNNTCAIYLQAPPYGVHMDSLFISGVTFGIMLAPPFTNIDAQVTNASNDGSIWSKLDINSPVPYVSWIGGINTFSDSTMYSGGQPVTYDPSTCPLCTREPQMERSFTLYRVPTHAGAIQSEMNSWLITNVYDEPNQDNTTNPSYGAIGQIDGDGHSMLGDTIISSSQFPLFPYVVGANRSKLDFAAMGAGALVLQGNGNTYNGTNDGQGNPSVIDLGIGNTNLNAVPQPTKYGLKPYYPNPVRQAAANKVTHEFLAMGAVSGDWFQSLDDLFMTPDDMMGTLSNVGTLVVDPTVPITGKYLNVPSPGLYVGSSQGLDAASISIGQRAPYGKGTFYIALQASTSAATQAWSTTCQYNTTGSSTVSLTTSWQIFSWPYDNTATSGCALGNTIGAHATASPSVPQDIHIGYYMWVPQTDYLQVGTLKLATLAAQAITGPTTINNLTSGSSTTVTVNHDYNLGQWGQCWMQSTGADTGKGLCVDQYGRLVHTLLGVPWQIGTAASYLTFNPSYIISQQNLGTNGQLFSHASAGTAPLVIDSTTPVANLTLASVTQLPSLASTNLSDTALLARLASPTFTGTVTTPTLNATTGLQVNGVALASSNLSDSASLAKLSSSNVFTAQQTAPNFVGVIGSESDITFSATPTFSATVNLNYLALTGNVTSSTLAAGKNGQSITFVVCQDATGSRTFAWPANVRGGMTIGSTASKCSSQMFIYANALSKWIAVDAGIANE